VDPLSRADIRADCRKMCCALISISIPVLSDEGGKRKSVNSPQHNRAIAGFHAGNYLPEAWYSASRFKEKY
jgi:hypothetical protein